MSSDDIYTYISEFVRCCYSLLRPFAVLMFLSAIFCVWLKSRSMCSYQLDFFCLNFLLSTLWNKDVNWYSAINQKIIMSVKSQERNGWTHIRSCINCKKKKNLNFWCIYRLPCEASLNIAQAATLYTKKKKKKIPNQITSILSKRARDFYFSSSVDMSSSSLNGRDKQTRKQTHTQTRPFIFLVGLQSLVTFLLLNWVGKKKGNFSFFPYLPCRFTLNAYTVCVCVRLVQNV